ncbi:YkgJ family cysteine cluster protein [candidate division KSB1 bacterium]|nr:YkgJ family cysteine cluster protein [candidate division KSB1 bacterium]
MDVKNSTEKQDLPAGCFSSWLRQIRSALIKENGIDVLCGECKACCTSSYFIHIRPEEIQTLKHIPGKLLFAAPGLPKGNVLLGYDKNGHCPMLIEDQCSIYEYRPLTCRNFDCRIFTAAGIAAGGDNKAQINQRAKRWKFTYSTQQDRDQHSAVQAAAKFIQEHAQCFPAGEIPGNPSQLAILAIKVYDVFLEYDDESDKTGHVFPDLKIAKAVMKANEKFETQHVSSPSSPQVK